MIDRLCWTKAAWADYELWQKDKKQLRRINTLIKAIMRDPHVGIGKPEPLKSNLNGFWSRRIDEKHRLVYMAGENQISIISCRGHYGS